MPNRSATLVVSMIERTATNGRQRTWKLATRSAAETTPVVRSTSTPTAATAPGPMCRPMLKRGKDSTRPTVIINVPYAIVSCIRTGSLIRMVQTSPAPLRVATSGRLVLSNNRADMLAAQRPIQKLGPQPVDDLELFQLPGVGQEVDHDPVERKRRQVARPQLGHGDLLDELGAGIDFRVRVVESVHVLDQGVGGATVALGEQEGAGVGAVGWDAPEAGRMLPNRERRVAVADHTRGRVDEEG